jgi:benzoylformate decarboxylase
VLVVGTAAFRQYAFEPGTLVERDVRVAVVSADAEEVHRSPAALAVLAAPASTCLALAGLVGQRPVSPPEARAQPVPAPPPAPGEPLRSVHVLDALAARLPPDTVLLEEAPSHRAELNARLPARAPLGFLSAAMGGLGFALPAATGLRLAMPGRPVVAVVGDGSSLYAIQSLWSAARYGAGALFVVLANGRYAIMDRLADIANATGPWPSFPEVDVAALARGFGCTALVTPEHEQLLDALDAIVPTLAERVEPVVLVVPVAD